MDFLLTDIFFRTAILSEYVFNLLFITSILHLTGSLHKGRDRFQHYYYSLQQTAQKFLHFDSSAKIPLHEVIFIHVHSFWSSSVFTQSLLFYVFLGSFLSPLLHIGFSQNIQESSQVYGCILFV